MRWALRSIGKTIFFNFHYLPFCQAIRLPIILYKPRLTKLKGKIIIEGGVRTGMVWLGPNRVSIYPNTGINYENNGGTIVFRGHCIIGNNSSLSLGQGSKLIFGSNFHATSSFRLACYNYIEFGNKVLFGWECIVVDTDFHKLEFMNREHNKGYGPIIIGNGNWICLRCSILKNTILPDSCVVSANSLLSKKYTESHCLISGMPAEIKRRGICRNPDDDKVEYK